VAEVKIGAMVRYVVPFKTIHFSRMQLGSHLQGRSSPGTDRTQVAPVVLGSHPLGCLAGSPESQPGSLLSGAA